MYFMLMIAYHCVNFDTDSDPDLDPDAYYFWGGIFVLLIDEQI